MLFSERELSLYALPAAINRGRASCAAHEVKLVGSDKEEAVGVLVSGQSTYRVAIQKPADGPVAFACSCGFAYGGACEHVVAVMLALGQRDVGRHAGNGDALIDIENRTSMPSCRLYLTEQHGMLLIETRFSYCDGLAEFRRCDRAPYRLVPSVTSDSVYRVTRSRAREDSLVAPLPSYGLLRYRPGVFTTAGAPREWVLETLPSLAGRGYEIFGQEHLPTLRVREEEPVLHVGLSYDGSRIDCEITASFGRIPATLAALVDAVRAESRYVLLSDGTTGQMPPEWLNTFAAILSMSAFDRGRDTLQLSGSQFVAAGILAGLADECDESNSFRERCRRLGESVGIAERQVPVEFKGTLRPYQKVGFEWLCFLHEHGLGACLADDMGLGKTIQTLAFLLQLRRSRPRRPSLIVAPTSVLFNWERELRRFVPTYLVMKYHGAGRSRYTNNDFFLAEAVLTSYGTLLRELDRLKNIEFGCVVLDEAQAVKNPSSHISHAVRELHTAHRLALTGTPVENSLTELWSLFAFLNPGMLGTYRRFVQAFAAPIQRENNTPTRDILARVVSPFVLRRTKQQVATELPPKTEDVVYVTMHERQRNVYNVTRDHYRVRVARAIERGDMERSRPQVLEALLRLRQVCCHPLLTQRGYTGDSAKFDTIEHLLGQIIGSGHKVLVFSQFVSALRLLRARLDSRGIGTEMLTGATRNRAGTVDRFQTDEGAPAFLISLKAGGVGLNLTAADYVIHLDPWWNPAVENQASDRAYRIGQTRPVFVYKLIACDSIEEKVLDLQRRKKKLVESIIRAEDTLLKQLSQEELLSLFS